MLTTILLCTGGGALGASEAEEPGRVALSFVGFFNSESHEFAPRRIGYSAMVSRADAHAELKVYLTQKSYQVEGYGAFEREVLPQIGKEADARTREAIRTALGVMNDYFRSGSDLCDDCESLRFIDLTGLPGAVTWQKRDRIVLFLGLETLSPSGRGLRSGLMGIAFDGHGAYMGHSIATYDFTKYSTGGLIRDCKSILSRIL